PVTIYKKDNSVLISLASWAKTTVNIHLKIDWKALGIDPSRATITAPAIDKFQSAERFKIGAAIPVEPNKGWLLEIK
ncbi:glycoside hydrolase domain-containing protein, partial [Arachidicoccus sp.]|uniref:glycoside hydrolase domain-containing protein n=1 Tax=Arachidicoccus sp. TaxID=1872624 RepID=UPI003D20239A